VDSSQRPSCAQAQRNMVHINEERVAALQELDAAYDRIAELGVNLHAGNNGAAV